MSKKPIYEIRDGADWLRVTGTTTPKGMLGVWLEYTFNDRGSTTTGLAKPGSWRERPTKLNRAFHALRDAELDIGTNSMHDDRAKGQSNNLQEQGTMRNENPNPTEDTPVEAEAEATPAAETAEGAPKPARKRAPRKAKAVVAETTTTETTEDTTVMTTKGKKKGKRAAKKATKATKVAKAKSNGAAPVYREGSKAARALVFWKDGMAKAHEKHGKDLPQGFRKDFIERMAKKCDLTVGSAGSLYQNFTRDHG